MDSTVLSVWTGADSSHGRPPSASGRFERAPYDQCLSSRRFMLMREVNVPPSTLFIVSVSSRLAALLEASTWPTRMLLCTAPGLSTRNTRGAEGVAASGSALDGRGVPAACQPPKCFSSTGRTRAAVVSPVTIRVALSGRSQSRWKATRSSRVSAATDASVPEPVNGMA